MILMPDPAGFVRSSFGLEANTLTFESPITRATQRVELAGDRWGASYTLRRWKKTDERAAAWIAFFLRCNGRSNAFAAYDPDRRNPRGVASGTPLVDGPGQAGKYVSVKNCPPNVTGWMKAGDYVGINNEMKQLVEDADTTAGGLAVLHFAPAMRAAAPDGSAVQLANVTCAMILADDRQGMWEADMLGIYEEKSFSAVEVF